MQNKQLVFVLLAACSAAPDKKLPGATFTPHLESQAASVACGEDVAFYGAASPDLQYAFTYNNDGMLTHVDGTWTAGGPAETIDYTYAGWNLTHMTETYDTSTYQIDATYDANGLRDYTWSYSEPDYSDSWTYSFSSFAAPNQPGHEDITQAGQPSFGYDLAYDADGRLTSAAPQTGPTTTWTYDDDAGTIDVDTGNGAWHTTMTYDADFKPISTTNGGTDPSVIDTAEVYNWNGDNLDTFTYSSGSEQAPHTLDLVQTSTMKYNCASARKLGGRISKLPRMHASR